MRIISFGDCPKASTGYGSTWDNLLTRWCKLKPDWEFYHMGWQNHDRPHQTKEGYWMLPLNQKEYGFDTVVEYVMKYNPDFVITMADIGWQAGYVDGIAECKKRGWRGKWIAYNPYDSDVFERLFWENILSFPDYNMAMANNGVEIQKKNGVWNTELIPLGVDTKIFFPMSDKEELKKKWKLNNNFVVGFVGRNQTRKMIDRLLKGFANFSKDKMDVKLLLHTDKIPPNNTMGWTLPGIIAKYQKEIDSTFSLKIVMSKDNLDIRARSRIQPESMNELFNAMDIFGYMTGGEGFGVPGLECQACGVPLLMTACTTAFELTGNGEHGFLIPVLKDKYDREVTLVGTNGVENYIPDDIEFAKMLEMFYNDWKNGSKLIKEKGLKAREFSLKYDWDLIADKWLKFFEEHV